MTLDELRALLSPDRLDEIAAHNCGASEVALGLASALVDALIERDTLRAGVERLTALLPTAEEREAVDKCVRYLPPMSICGVVDAYLVRTAKGGE